ncbi:MAG: CocE/NonD family hydrolase [Acidobacteriota bacterium]|nr:CocE/NonD family hydrolase [Acidobacteriota bacterium]
MLVRLVLLALCCSFCVAADTRSAYLTTGDGTKLAVDFTLPEGIDKAPALLVLTRYWRAAEDLQGKPLPALNSLDRLFLENGYAVVKVDVRGSGASFGTRPVEYGPQEVRDGYDVISWVIAQPWSNGKVGAFGTSYTGTTAEFLAATKHPALKAVIPGWSDFDVYRSPARPYGMLASRFIETWSNYVGALDRNDDAVLNRRVKRVETDADAKLRDAAVAQHKDNPNVFEWVKKTEFRDQRVKPGGPNWAESASLHWKKNIEASGVPMLVLASWLDAGTAAGALIRYQHYTNRQKVIILASSHGGGFHASPYTVSDKPGEPVPSVETQMQWRLDFFDYHLKGKATGVDQWPGIQYFNLGEEKFHKTETWPVKGMTYQPWYLHPEGKLTDTRPGGSKGDGDSYKVDFTATTGKNNRWMTQMGAPVFNLDRRETMAERMLTYTSEPLPADLQLTGDPLVTLEVISDHSDGAFFVYLEDVSPEGQSRYVTEGGLRALHRKLAPDKTLPKSKQMHSFNRADAMPLKPGEPARLVFNMWPTSVLIRKGHRIRIAVAGADADMFDRIPTQGNPTIQILRNKAQLSFVDLPVVSR